MKEKISDSILWSEGRKYALALSIIPIVCSVLFYFLVNIEAEEYDDFFTLISVFIICGATFFLCFFFMLFSMQQLVKKYDEVNNATSNKFGRITSLFSAFYITIGTLIFLTFCTGKDYISSPGEEVSEYSYLLIISLCVFLYWFLYGVVLSAILSRNIPSRNPSNDTKPKHKSPKMWNDGWYDPIPNPFVDDDDNGYNPRGEDEYYPPLV